MRETEDRSEPANPAKHREANAGLRDAELAAACRRGSLEAFEQLYLEQGARLKSVAFNLLGNASDAEDAVQEVFLRVYRGIGSFKGQSAFSTWIYRILVNCCFDLGRRKARRQEASEPEPDEGREAEAWDAVAAPVADHPLRLALESCMKRLSPKHREVFVLFEVEGFRHAEIASILDISEALSKNRLFEAKQQLRQWLKSEKGL